MKRLVLDQAQHHHFQCAGKKVSRFGLGHGGLPVMNEMAQTLF
jgi:hypothetical protein